MIVVNIARGFASTRPRARSMEESIVCTANKVSAIVQKIGYLWHMGQEVTFKITAA